ncbi:zinc finger protein, partial [Laetiporus sulphureus 93-53]
ATSLSWNGSKFECVLCHKEFSHLGCLNQHLNSPAHDEEIYKCPRGWQGCGTEFCMLSALCHHVESEQCGVHRFNKAVQEMVGSLTSDMHCLTM